MTDENKKVNIVPLKRQMTFEERQQNRKNYIKEIAEKNPRAKIIPCTTEESIAIAELAIGWNTQVEALRSRLGLDIDLEIGMALLREGAVHIVGMEDVMLKIAKLTGRRVGNTRSFRATALMKNLMGKSNKEETDKVSP